MRIVWLIRFLEAVIMIVLDTFTPGSIAQFAVAKDQLDHLRSECGLIPVATMAEGLDIQPASVAREPRTLSEDCALSDKLLLSVLSHLPGDGDVATVAAVVAVVPPSAPRAGDAPPPSPPPAPRPS
ncbi:hypothetical protein BDV32DRAFT_144327 [Aspergillus pseudonomiae]|uniref:Uncharacterized protein n=1 Tax=Aspergillus pseudonomiae TaxID=1506151 RepID=A0A5N6IH88_9EURO|nr:uncharacterized protein BDV37DRAFT_286020 [Aspergillus pseudonomiae]KAB8265805.1 hypothetical protein BDV32DRAFT_144327 [Aspergillus pseudonomiae]KAE8401047.1 hypothetical protein BDV37DRAFT_286020 [Aspergillus pseudonomiae]